MVFRKAGSCLNMRRHEVVSCNHPCFFCFFHFSLQIFQRQLLLFHFFFQLRQSIVHLLFLKLSFSCRFLENCGGFVQTSLCLVRLVFHPVHFICCRCYLLIQAYNGFFNLCKEVVEFTFFLPLSNKLSRNYLEILMS